jgi:hypothetical protein
VTQFRDIRTRDGETIERYVDGRLVEQRCRFCGRGQARERVQRCEMDTPDGLVRNDRECWMECGLCREVYYTPRQLRENEANQIVV